MQNLEKPLLNVLIIAKYDPTIDWIQLFVQEQNYNVVGHYESVGKALNRLNSGRVDIVLADSSGEGVVNTNWIQTISTQLPGVLILVIANSMEMDFVREAMLAGASGFLLRPFGLLELSRSVEQVHQLWLQRHALLLEDKSDSSEAAAQKAHSVAVFSRKGGTGTTTIAVNLAIALQRQTEKPVLLVDADLRTPDVDIFLNVFGKTSFLDLMGLDQRIDRELLDQVTTSHVSGITVLRGDPQLQFIDSPFDTGKVGEVIEDIIAHWDGYVVINTNNSLERWTVEILDVVDTVLVVTTPELPALRVTRNFLELAEAKEDITGKWQVIMTSYQGSKTVQVADIETSIHYPITATIARDNVLVTSSVNRGVPLLTSNKKSAIAKDLNALAQELIKLQAVATQINFADERDVPPDSKKMNQPQPPKKKFSFWQSITNAANISIGG
ncbi:MAG: AAA family ATPase [Anaerolineae bacterium]|nr:AAA family ATPase [Anaerolineae bacterium]